MKFDCTTGKLELTEDIYLCRGMTRHELLATDWDWERWIERDGETIAYRTTFTSLQHGKKDTIVLIVFFTDINGPIIFWSVYPNGKFDGAQKRPSGKFTKLCRAWFNSVFECKVPCSNNEVDIDVSHDPRNLTTSVICSYRDRFPPANEWRDFIRISNRH